MKKINKTYWYVITIIPAIIIFAGGMAVLGIYLSNSQKSVITEIIKPESIETIKEPSVSEELVFEKPDTPAVTKQKTGVDQLPAIRPNAKNTVRILKYHVWDILTEGGEEEKGYGLYTYVLFGRRVNNPNALDAETLDRYQSLLNAITTSTPSTEEAIMWQKELSNIFYIPSVETNIVKYTSSPLRNYNSSLAMSYLVALSDVLGDPDLQQQITMNPGPFLISTLQPLSQLRDTIAVMLYVDLSDNNPDGMREVVSSYKSYVTMATIDEVEQFSSLRLALLNFILNANDNLKIVKTAIGAFFPERQ